MSFSSITNWDLIEPPSKVTWGTTTENGAVASGNRPTIHKFRRLVAHRLASAFERLSNSFLPASKAHYMSAGFVSTMVSPLLVCL